jgi:hypothetical protein
MAAEVEIVQVSTKSLTDGMLLIKDSVVGTTTHTGLDTSVYGKLKRTQYAWLTTAGSTYILSTAANLESLYIVPTSSGGGAFSLLDGTTAILTIPAASYVPDPRPHLVPLGGIRNTSTAGFKVTLGASVACLVVGAFVGAITTA